METNVDTFEKIKIDGIESTMAEARSNPDEQNYTKDDPGKIQVGEFRLSGFEVHFAWQEYGTLFMCHVTAP